MLNDSQLSDHKESSSNELRSFFPVGHGMDQDR